MRTLLLGDTHGRTKWTIAAIDYAVSVDANTIIQFGDFGFWPRFHSWPDHFLAPVADHCAKLGVVFYFIDGNHDDHSELYHDALQPVFYEYGELGGGFWHLPRGYVATWGEVTFAVMGGAGSIDQEHRTEGWDWFKEEEPSIAQANRALDNVEDGIDVLFSHDCTTAAFDVLLPDCSVRVGDWTRQANAEIMVRGKARLNIHGHHHKDRVIEGLRERHWTYTSWGLNNEYGNGAMFVVNFNEPIELWRHQGVPIKAVHSARSGEWV